ncbi:MAG: peptidoglycan-binding protein, partial [Candidatus Taylorbacteria bacterium]|nr:peptidoglycan-binding protein [Candidatus Taylorbacteria bacterium]
LLLLIIIAGVAIYIPQGVSADHSDFHKLQQLQQQISILQNRVNALAAFLFAAKPEDTGKPADIGKPADTSKPQDIGKPAETSLPPVTPITPAQPIQPVAPEEPANQKQPTQPVTPVQPTVQGDADKPADIVKPADTSTKTAQPAILTQTTEPKIESGPVITRSLGIGSSGEDVKKLQGFLKKFPDIYPEGLETGYYGPATEAAVKKFQEKNGLETAGIVGPKTRALLSGNIQGITAGDRPILPKALVTKTLQRGASGNDVRGTQELLNKFPDIYPQGLVTGFFGPATETAVKKLQEKFELPVTGSINETTRKKINDLAAAIGRKQSPKITSITPSEISVTTKVTLTGSGFTLENNSLFVRGKTILTGLTSHDGTEIVFAMPADILCEIGSACPIKITNSNGISNAKPIKLVELVSPPPPEPLPEPTPTPTPPPAPVIKDTTPPVRSDGEPSGILPSDTTSATISLTTDEKATCKYVTDASGVSYVEMPNTFSNTNSTFHSSIVSVQAISPSYPTGYGFNVRCQDSDGNSNTDDYPILFSVANKPLVPTITVVSPNGGEAYKYGDTMTIMWATKNMTGQKVRIGLFRGINQVVQIATEVPQSAADGTFLYNWVIPNNIPAAADYTVRVNDAVSVALIADFSDSQFRISANTSLQIYGPNGGETAMRGFSTFLFWTYNGYTPASINVNLYKGGVFYRTLATGITPVGFSGYTFLKASYPTNSRYAEVPIALDIPEGDDYTLEIVDGADAAIRDKSDAPFRIISFLSPVTFTGRLVDGLSGAALPNVSFFDWSRISTTTFTTGSNGEFSFSADVSAIADSATRYKFLVAGVPQCGDATSLSLYRYPDFPRTTFGGWFGGLYPNSSVRKLYLPVTSSVMNLGDVPAWPTADFIYTYNDIRAGFMVSYLVDGRVMGGTGNIGKTFKNGLSNTPPLGADMYIEYSDQAGALYRSATSKYSTEPRCPVAAHSFMDGIYKWEPYPLGITIDWTGGSIGTIGEPFKITAKVITSSSYFSVGKEPYVWGTLGILPPGLKLNFSTGEISGTPTTAGVYTFGVRVTDANGVRASQDISVTIK